MRILAVGRNFPKRCGICLLVLYGKAQRAPSWRPLRRRRPTSHHDQAVGFRSIALCKEKFVAFRVEKSLAVGRPRGGVAHGITKTPRWPAKYGQSPEGAIKSSARFIG